MLRRLIYHSKGMLIIALESGDWTMQSAPLLIVINQKAKINCSNPQIGKMSIHEKPKKTIRFQVYEKLKNQTPKRNSGLKTISNNCVYEPENEETKLFEHSS